MGRLFLLFTLTPVLELWLLIEIGRRIGATPTVLIVLVTGVLGAWLARREGARTFYGFNQTIQRGQMPTEQIIDGMMILAGGAFLVTPGVVTDALGFALLVPGSRKVLKRWVRTWVKKRVHYRTTILYQNWQRPESGQPPSDRVVDQTLDETERQKRPE